jgi:hypothetical protein
MVDRSPWKILKGGSDQEKVLIDTDDGRVGVETRYDWICITHCRRGGRWRRPALYRTEVHLIGGETTSYTAKRWVGSYCGVDKEIDPILRLLSASGLE